MKYESKSVSSSFNITISNHGLTNIHYVFIYDSEIYSLEGKSGIIKPSESIDVLIAANLKLESYPLIEIVNTDDAAFECYKKLIINVIKNIIDCSIENYSPIINKCNTINRKISYSLKSLNECEGGLTTPKSDNIPCGNI